MGALSLCWVSIHLLHWRGIGTGSYASTGARWLSPCLCSRRAAAGTTPSSATPPSTKSAWTPSPPSAGRYEKPPAPSLRISPSFCHGVVASRGQGRTRPAPFLAPQSVALPGVGRKEALQRAAGDGRVALLGSGFAHSKVVRVC